MSRYADCMPAIFGLLFREIYQWRSLEIMSNTWIPIHSALQLLNERRTEGPSALHPESIKLQRTNDYLSCFWLFCPGIMKTVEGTMFGALIGATSQDVPAQSPPPPQTAKHNSIWRSPELEKLSSLYSWCNSQSLYPVSGALLSQRRSILEACPRLQNLILRFSGPLGGFPRQVSLPLLQELHYGYFCVGDDIRLFMFVEFEIVDWIANLVDAHAFGRRVLHTWIGFPLLADVTFTFLCMIHKIYISILKIPNVAARLNYVALIEQDFNASDNLWVISDMRKDGSVETSGSSEKMWAVQIQRTSKMSTVVIQGLPWSRFALIAATTNIDETIDFLFLQDIIEDADTCLRAFLSLLNKLPGNFH
ncbi:hypothetical protein BDR07DRAFT_1487795 [Suillus spraguei]|nr:hypothetical protein BDR07DRAFT_1487795 [Suillus spraguei]